MKLINRNNKFISSIYLLLLVIFLSGCTKNVTESKNNKLSIIEGTIQSKSIDIPNDSLVTLSLSPIGKNENESITSDNFQFKTKKSGRFLAFKIRLSSEMNKLKSQLGLSARIEKDNQLIMMSDTINPIPKSASGHVSITVITSQ
ncbi:MULTISPECIES: YbaY family lipoprotein [Providencia]|uniref:YbaY family lipoprotein n=2 Tax=Providencia TaxID=586 RepID=A0AAI9MXI0_PROST|nr:MULTISPECIES: YbaY family lipoprotein [unclassified Providencia]ELR5036295.1 YbaY family lipoprotein [Providencia stuartii]ELR5046473.1 YbaY family lipoprotein [Providencia rettgeri]MCR4181538.1 YbaY family lipoprotein [Providencia vermicola]ELR5292859.1 YbaY family lipoprotein [Providencia stuartii]ELZ5940485.1 YbaY family lipoprotein [Providencia stuartii]